MKSHLSGFVDTTNPPSQMEGGKSEEIPENFVSEVEICGKKFFPPKFGEISGRIPSEFFQKFRTTGFERS